MRLLITFTCYGSHLPGDPRGSFDHVRNAPTHKPGRLLPPNPALEQYHRHHLKHDPYFLSTAQSRATVRDAVISASAFRAWFLYALHVRTTHVHGVVEAECPPSRIFHLWKAYATRSLRSACLAAPDRIMWTHGGNALRLASPEALQAAIRYVIEEQGEPMELYLPDPARR